MRAGVVIAHPRLHRAWARWLALQAAHYLHRGASVEHIGRLLEDIAFLTATAADLQPAPLN